MLLAAAARVSSPGEVDEMGAVGLLLGGLCEEKDDDGRLVRWLCPSKINGWTGEFCVDSGREDCAVLGAGLRSFDSLDMMMMM